MDINQLADEFNNTSINLLDLLYSFNNDDSIIFYKTTVNNLIKIENKKMIDELKGSLILLPPSLSKGSYLNNFKIIK